MTCYYRIQFEMRSKILNWVLSKVAVIFCLGNVFLGIKKGKEVKAVSNSKSHFYTLEAGYLVKFEVT